MYGPGSVIQGNTIEQANRTGGKVFAYSILLRDAKGAVVRGNRIRNSGSSRNTVAVGLKDSLDVFLESNTFVNIQTTAAPIGGGAPSYRNPDVLDRECAQLSGSRFDQIQGNGEIRAASLA